MSHILVTHSHVDHSPLARSLSADTGAKVYAFGDSATGRSPAMTELAQFGEIGGGEGVDQSFTPDVQLADGDIIEGEDWSLTALHTPGHFGNHMCFVGKGYAFTGDHVMEWASSLVSPPDGDLTDFLASCRKLASTGAKVGYSGHGAPIEDLPARLKALIEHRLDRETQIRTVLTRGPMTPAEITKCLYTDVNPALLPMAERNVLAHLVDLTGRGLVSPEGRLTAGAKFISRSG